MVPAPFDRESTRAWLDRQITAYSTRGYALWIVEDRASGTFLGTAGPTLQIVEEVDEVEIGWHTRPGRKGEGIAPEAAVAARDWAFANLDVDHVISLVRPENLASVRVAEKIGMHVDRGGLQGPPASRVPDRSAQSGSSRRGSSAVTEPSGTRSRVYA